MRFCAFLMHNFMPCMYHKRLSSARLRAALVSSKRWLTACPHYADLKPLTERIAQERKLMHSRAETLLPIEIDEWQGHLGAVLQGAPDWEVRGHLGNRGLFVLRELLQLLPTWEAVRPDIRRFLEAALQASQALVSMIAGAALAHTPSCVSALDTCMLSLF